MIQTLLDGGEQLYLMILHTLQIRNIGGKCLRFMPSIVQDKECSSCIVGEHSLSAKKRLEGIPVHPQMSFDGYGAAFDEGSRQNAL
jgi:hypothetical protein